MSGHIVQFSIYGDFRPSAWPPQAPSRASPYADDPGFPILSLVLSALRWVFDPDPNNASAPPNGTLTAYTSTQSVSPCKNLT